MQTGRDVLNMWKWGVVFDCPVVLIALDEVTSHKAKAERALRNLFEQHAWQVTQGQVAVTNVTTDPDRWVEVRTITYGIKILSSVEVEPCKNDWEVLFSKICKTFKNREVTPHVHLITHSSSSVVPFDKLQTFEGNLIFHIHQLGSDSFTRPENLPESIQFRHSFIADENQG